MIALDLVQEKVDLVNQRQSPIEGIEIEKYLTQNHLNLFATLDKHKAYSDADIVIIATPTEWQDTFNGLCKRG